MPIDLTLANLPACISSCLGRASQVVKKNETAASEAKAIGVLVSAGAVKGLFGRCIIMLALGSFSIPSLLFWGAVGASAGALVSSPIIYSFLSNMTKRENS
ncbi:MAG TPA: hypothetical protein VHK67_06065 [Rhabdochlamydiaceae bacterium]|jgi:hypothetical protein|nr:hypothetical protein [Rhabdochlamydiaceae bacterium]